jgi:hypothetical protein
MEKYLIIIGILIGLYFIYKYNESLVENFEAPAQSLGGVDDTNAINTLAQIAKNLMAGGLTVPGNMTVNGVLSPAHSVWHTSTDGKQRLHYGNNSHSFYKTGDAHVWKNNADQDRMILDANGALNTTGNINASTGANNTRIGGIWTAPGIYAEGDKNLEVGAGSGNIFIGAANGGANQNLVVTGNITSGVNVWNKSRDGKNRTYYANNGRTYYGSADGVHSFRDGADGGGRDIMNIVPGKVMVEGRLFISKPNIKATDGYDGPGQIAGTTSLYDCAQKCIEKAYNTQVAMRKKSDGFCWCKDAFVWMHQSNDFDSMITL